MSAVTGVCILCYNQVQGGKGWLGVVGVGFDFQPTANIVVGVFGDFNYASLKGTIQDQGPFFAGDIKEKSAWAAGARAGWLITPDFLAYVNGGYTSARFSGTNMVITGAGAPTTFTTPAFTANGWFIGVGTEMAMHSILGMPLGPGWFWRNEYRYASYRNTAIPDTSRSGAIQPTSTSSRPSRPLPRNWSTSSTPAGRLMRAAPSMPVNWTGFYVNGGFGYGGWAADTTTESPITGACILCYCSSAGRQRMARRRRCGFDFQVMPKVVVGVFGDYDFSSLKGTIQDQVPFFAGDIKQTSAWAAGARAGWLVTPQILSYVNGGYTKARFSGTNMVTTFVGAPTTFSTPAFNTHGWFFGGGGEAAITPNLFWR